ncbi:MAG: hypothetical protein IKK89_06915 [Alistipes sp.]|nr:hypothetical protein [Alistipes sp.]MBR6631658.1 hypothetical protein [Alistipes sp.]
MKSLLHIISLAIVSISCVSCEDEIQEKANEFFTIKSPISMLVTIPELGIENALFESDGFPVVLTSINPLRPHMYFNNYAFGFLFQRTLTSTFYKELEANLELCIGSATQEFELHKEYQLRPMDEDSKNNMYIVLAIRNAEGNYVYKADASRDGYISFTSYTETGDTIKKCTLSGEFECNFTSEYGNAKITNGVFTEAPCSLVTRY